MQKTTITVLGVGNILLQDEGFGVRVIETMTRRFSFPPNVQVLDGGTLGIELLRFLEDTEKLIIVDAIAGGKPPGTVYQFSDSEVLAYFKDKVSAHELGIQDVLATLRVRGKQPITQVVIGVEPQTLDVGLELTPIVGEQLETVIEQILKWLKKWQVEVKRI